mmetsp:Transcript_43854/g.121431  ORF Transcript_43854/g.121431 Transcript_43854/m.121431 type:complete len:294 (-) Transcript_43854:662-1543(-)
MRCRHAPPMRAPTVCAVAPARDASRRRRFPAPCPKRSSLFSTFDVGSRVFRLEPHGRTAPPRLRRRPTTFGLRACRRWRCVGAQGGRRRVRVDGDAAAAARRDARRDAGAAWRGRGALDAGARSVGQQPGEVGGRAHEAARPGRLDDVAANAAPLECVLAPPLVVGGAHPLELGERRQQVANRLRLGRLVDGDLVVGEALLVRHLQRLGHAEPAPQLLERRRLRLALFGREREVAAAQQVRARLGHGVDVAKRGDLIDPLERERAQPLRVGHHLLRQPLALGRLVRFGRLGVA